MFATVSAGRLSAYGRNVENPQFGLVPSRRTNCASRLSFGHGSKRRTRTKSSKSASNSWRLAHATPNRFSSVSFDVPDAANPSTYFFYVVHSFVYFCSASSPTPISPMGPISPMRPIGPIRPILPPPISSIRQIHQGVPAWRTGFACWLSARCRSRPRVMRTRAGGTGPNLIVIRHE